MVNEEIVRDQREEAQLEVARNLRIALQENNLTQAEELGVLQLVATMVLNGQ